MFISLKWKAIILTTLLLLGLSFLFAHLADRQLSNLAHAQRSENYLRYHSEIKGLLSQSSRHLLQLSDLIPLMQGGTDIKSTLNQHWEYIQINWALEGISLYNHQGSLVARRGNTTTRLPHKIIVDVLRETTPQGLMQCAQYCVQTLVIPLFDRAGNTNVLQLDTAIADLLIAFKDVTQSDIGILADINDKTPSTLQLKRWQRQLSGLTNRDYNQPLLETLSQQYSLAQLLASNRTIEFKGKRYEVGLIDAEARANNSVYFVVIADISNQHQFINDAIKTHISGGISAIILCSLLITAMLWQPITRLRRQAELLPLLSEGKFSFVREALQRKDRRAWFPDELDILDQTEVEVSTQLEKMQGKIQENTDELTNLAMYDSLTGLANRRHMMQCLKTMLDNSMVNSHIFGLLFLDLDNFKRINDSLGHRTGDELLRIVARRVKSCVRNQDMVARLGGDEFCVLIDNLRTERDGNVAAANILNILKNPVKLGNTEVIISASIGIVTAPRDGKTAEELLQHADLAMYKAKAQGRNSYQLFDQSMNLHAVEQLSLENELRRALVAQEFVVHYQPQINLNDNSIVSVEALVRWNHPRRGLLGPGYFVNILEETGLIVALGEWVLLTACQTLQRWLDLGLPPIKMCVNLSPRQFRDPKLFAMIEQTLAITRLQPQLLELEITESMLMEDIESHNRTLQQLKALGTSVAIDDFGTGYSSLSYLKSLPLDTLKIDRSFIADIPQSSADRDITAAIIAVAHKLKLHVVAEGIETSDQQAFLLSENCDLGQGYLFSRPIPESDMVELLRNSQILNQLGAAN